VDMRIKRANSSIRIAQSIVITVKGSGKASLCCVLNTEGKELKKSISCCEPLKMCHISRNSSPKFFVAHSVNHTLTDLI
jgi:hypothetical protein